MSLFDDNQRVPIKLSVKKKVYERAKGRCEKCKIKLEMNQGDFHHTRNPTASAAAKTVVFLCPTCHRIYGHKRTVRTESNLFGEEKVIRVKRLNPVKKSKHKPKTKKKVKRRKTYGLFTI
jgi:cytochrome c553